MTIILETDRLILRPWADGDAEGAFAILGDPEVTRYLGETGEPFPDLAQAQAWLERIHEKYTAWGSFGSWAAVERATGEIIGGGGLIELDGGPDVEVFYHFRRASWGNGYATELTRALIAYAFAQLDLPRVVGVAYPANTASHRVMEKAGMTHQGLRQSYGTEMECFVIERRIP